jgi:hypothetical protein
MTYDSMFLNHIKKTSLLENILIMERRKLLFMMPVAMYFGRSHARALSKLPTCLGDTSCIPNDLD